MSIVRVNNPETALQTKGQIDAAIAPLIALSLVTGSELIATVDAVAASIVEFDGFFTNAYDSYVIDCPMVVPSVSLTLSAQVKIAGAYITTGHRITGLSHDEQNATITGKFATNNSSIAMSEVNLVNGQATTFKFELHNPTNTTESKIFSSKLINISVLKTSDFAHVLNNNAAITAIKFFTSTGTVTGKFRLYGRRV